MPVHLSHSARLDSDESGRKLRGNREIGGINDFYRAAWDDVRLLLREMVCVRLVYGEFAGGRSDILRGDIRWRRSAIENLSCVRDDVISSGLLGHETMAYPL